MSIKVVLVALGLVFVLGCTTRAVCEVATQGSKRQVEAPCVRRVVRPIGLLSDRS